MIDHRERHDRIDVAAELRTAAEAHRPDRARMLARVTAGMAGDRRRRTERWAGRPWTRVAGPVAGLAAAVAAAGIVVLATDPAQRPQTVRTSSEPAVPPAHAGRDTGNGGGTDDGSQRHTPTASPTAVGPNHLADPVVRSTGEINPGSNPYWAQSDVIVKTGKPLTSLTVELRVAHTGGVLTTGSWSTLPTGSVNVSVRSEKNALVYRWTLKDGATVPAGRHVFAGQYNHAEGDRDISGDGYSASGNGPSGAFAVRGRFREAK
ncbi:MULTISPECIES: hypothetical protein [unclassified Streptomyces]|uniref:hypothetical protein n=1 Tax=unclassified Streptomyces TaxID=2593676 RepID=UPI00336A147C